MITLTAAPANYLPLGQRCSQASQVRTQNYTEFPRALASVIQALSRLMKHSLHLSVHFWSCHCSHLGGGFIHRVTSFYSRDPDDNNLDVCRLSSHHPKAEGPQSHRLLCAGFIPFGYTPRSRMVDHTVVLILDI